tara:strand:- start:20545 stop:22251 length:1707 start_codon:yes stop_codon:yes gene_type:complete
MANDIVVNWLDNHIPDYKNKKMKNIPFNNENITRAHMYMSKYTPLQNTTNNDPIFVFTQFYISSNKARNNELKKVLELMVINKNIEKIYLLNERIYRDDELGIQSDKIQQMVINNRLTYKICYDKVEELNLNGYIILTNSDIFFDKSITNIKKTNFHKERAIFTLLRHEFNVYNNLSNCKLFGPRHDSQDTWIFHSNFNIPSRYRNAFDFILGIPGCDNKVIYLYNILGYECYNNPTLIKCYHYQLSSYRNYKKNKLRLPYMYVIPSFGDHNYNKYNFAYENETFYNWLNEKLNNNKSFIVPRLAGVENNMAHLGYLYTSNKSNVKENKILPNIPVMKNNAGIFLKGFNSFAQYSKLYLEAFELCELFFYWPEWSSVSQYSRESYTFIYNKYKKQLLSSDVLNIFNHIHNNPWTLALRKKRLLIISCFVESIKLKLENRDKIYGIDLFPECEFIFLKPPQTHGKNDSRDFQLELEEFCKEIEKIKDSFDVALCSCGGYGNLVCSSIYKMNKSAIYVGGVLQMYFGIYGQRWIDENPDVLTLYKNTHWTRPNQEEKPNGFTQIENNCYW